MALFVGAVPDDKLPKDAAAGQTLTGTLALAHQGSGHAPGTLPLTYRCSSVTL